MKKKNIERILSFDSNFDKVAGIVRVHKSWWRVFAYNSLEAIHFLSCKDDSRNPCKSRHLLSGRPLILSPPHGIRKNYQLLRGDRTKKFAGNYCSQGDLPEPDDIAPVYIEYLQRIADVNQSPRKNNRMVGENGRN
jgi:hypothetical protein